MECLNEGPGVSFWGSVAITMDQMALEATVMIVGKLMIIGSTNKISCGGATERIRDIWCGILQKLTDNFYMSSLFWSEIENK